MVGEKPFIILALSNPCTQANFSLVLSFEPDSLQYVEWTQSILFDTTLGPHPLSIPIKVAGL